MFFRSIHNVVRSIYRGNNIYGCELEDHNVVGSLNKDTDIEVTTLCIEHTTFIYSICLMVEHIHVTSLETIGHVLKQLRQIVILKSALETIGHLLKQLRQIAILKSALNNDETAMNKWLEFGFLGCT